MLCRIHSVVPGRFAAALGKRREIEPSVHLRHHRKRNDIRLFRKDTAMRARSIFVLAFTFSMPSLMQAQVTHGQKPKLPAPFATKSSGNGPDSAKPPAGFLPTVPPGFRLNVFAANFKRPRWLTVAPNGDIFLADTGAGGIIVMRDPQHTGAAQQREVFVSGRKRPVGIAFRGDYAYAGNMNQLVRLRYHPK